MNRELKPRMNPDGHGFEGPHALLTVGLTINFKHPKIVWDRVLSLNPRSSVSIRG